MSSSVPLAGPELQALLVAPDFTGAIFEAAEHSLDTGNEAGFAVYRAASGVLISQVIHAEDYPIEGSKPSDSIDLTSITHESEDVVRPDLVDGVHTHPDGPWSNQLLSAADLKTHALEDYQMPGLVTMMAIPRPRADVVQLTIVRARPGKEGKLRCQYINRLGDSVTSAEIRDAMDYAGMGSSYTAYDLRTRKLRDDPRLIVGPLFRADYALAPY